MRRDKYITLRSKRMNGHFENISVNYGGAREYEAKVIVIPGTINIDPTDPYIRNFHIYFDCIAGYDDNMAVDTVLLDLNSPPEMVVILRFPSAEAKTVFVELIRPNVNSDSEDSGSLTPSPPPPQDNIV